LETAWTFLAVIILGVVIAVRIRLVGIPLERDVGLADYFPSGKIAAGTAASTVNQ
jgi:hypothetical protein